MIDEFNTFVADVSDSCERINSTAQVCVDNTKEDVNAEKLRDIVKTCTGKIKEACEDIQTVIKALQYEVERAQKSQQLADSDD